MHKCKACIRAFLHLCILAFLHSIHQNPRTLAPLTTAEVAPS